MHRTTITRAQGAEKLQAFLRDALRVLGVAAGISDNLPDALFRFRDESSPFRLPDPEQLVSAGRADDLLRVAHRSK